MVKIHGSKKEKVKKKFSVVKYRALLKCKTKEVGKKKGKVGNDKPSGVSGEDEGIWGCAIEMSGGFSKRKRYRNISRIRSISWSPTGYRGGHERDHSTMVENRSITDKLESRLGPP